MTVADGIAFSSSNLMQEQPSLTYIFDEIERTVCSEKYHRSTDLKRWSNQGILLINTALTTTVGKVGTHYLIWKPFISFLLDRFLFEKPDLIYVFLGSKAKEWSHSIPDSNPKLFAVHPAAAAHNREEKWDSEDLFNKINSHLEQKIIW